MMPFSDVFSKIKHSKDKKTTDYTAKPSHFIKDKSSFLYTYLKDELVEELHQISHMQLADGSYQATWQWYTDFKKEELMSLQIWKSIISIANLSFYHHFCHLIK